jgi:hypothetical protein
LKEVLGVDVGGVIIDRVNDGTDTSFFGRNFLLTTAVAGVFDVLRQLNERFDKIVLVSKCGQSTQDRTRQWLAHHNFYERTGIAEVDVHFCRERREKAPICQKLGVTHFIDDRLEVLGYLESVSHLYLFQPIETEVKRFSRFLPRVKRMNSWQEVLRNLTIT